jgi:hypothetical protein
MKSGKGKKQNIRIVKDEIKPVTISSSYKSYEMCIKVLELTVHSTTATEPQARKEPSTLNCITKVKHLSIHVIK